MKNIYRIIGLAVVAMGLMILPKPAPEAVIKPGCSDIGNPAYAYCADIMGYEYETITQGDGSQDGVCKMPDGEACAQWDFYVGKCGAAYSYCALAGYDLVTRSDGKDPYSQEYAVCLDHNRAEVGSISNLSGLGRVDGRSAFEAFESDLASIGPLSPASSGARAPSSFDWRNYLSVSWITPIKNQLSCGSCWAFSTVGLTEAQHNIIANNPNLNLDLAEQYLVSECCSYGDCGGGYDVYALEFIRDYGVPDEQCYPYQHANSACEPCPDYASRLKFVPNAHWSTSYTASNIKDYISSYGPVTIAIGTCSGSGCAPGTDFGSYWDGDIYRCTHDVPSDGTTGIDHSVLAVGYDDAGGYWIVKNSWGTGWGESGFFKLGYNECNVEHGQISWTESPLPVEYYSYLPMIIK